MPFLPFAKNKEEDLQKDLAFFALTAVEAISHLDINGMLDEVIERLKAFFKTDYACIHFYPNLGLDDSIIKQGLDH